MKKLIIFSQIVIFSILIILNEDVIAQNNVDTASSFLSSNIKVSGDIGVYGELYNMSGSTSRRPSSTGRIYFRPTLTLFNLLSIPFDFFVSTEGSSTRQNINHLGISPSWDWGKVHLGDFSTGFSDFTLNGISIRGGGVEINPGIFRLSTVSGYTQRLVEGGATNGSYDRFLFGSRIGVGREEGSYFDLILLKVKDEIGNISSDVKSINIINPNGNDEIPVGNLQTIRWGSNNLVGNVNIELSRDGGLNYEMIVENYPNTGYYNWSVSGPETYQALVRITSIDDSISDISDQFFSIRIGIQYKEGEIISDYTNPFAITPQENLVLGTAGKINFWEDNVSLKFELTGSVLSKDLRASSIDIDTLGLPKFINDIYKVRNGTNADYVLNTELGLNFGQFNSRVGYRSIGAGYSSLGMASLLNDSRELFISSAFTLSKISLAFNFNRHNDNLNDQKLFTTFRNNINVSLNGRFVDYWNVGLFMNFLNMNNDSKNDTMNVDFSTLNLGLNQMFTIGQNTFLRNLSLNYNYQTSENKTIFFQNNGNTNHTLNIGASFYINDKFQVNSNFGIINSTIQDTISSTTTNISIGLQHNAFNNSLRNTLTITNASIKENNSFRIAASANYSISTQDFVTLVLNYMNYNSSEIYTKDFSEIISSVNFTHRF